MPSKPVARARRTTRAAEQPLRVALVQDFLTDIGGAEQVLFELARLYPEAPVYTLLFDAERLGASIDPSRVVASPLTGVPGFMRRNRFRRYLFPLFPRAIEQFDLSGFDVVISSANSYAKGIITKPETLHVCYCHSPTRYLWDWHSEYLREQKLGFLKRWYVEPKLTDLRQWDLLASERVDRFVANSEHVRKRIAKYYRRDSTVIYPPITLPAVQPSRGHAGYFLIVSRLEPYKRIDLALKAFARMKDLPLVVIGDGSQRRALREMAPPNVEFLGLKDRATVEAYMQGARAFIFPGEDDFGMAPVEAMAAGRPVIAYGRGGALESVVEGVTGTFFHEATPKDLKEAVMRFTTMEAQFDHRTIRARAEHFSAAAFARRMRAFVQQAWEEHRATFPA